MPRYKRFAFICNNKERRMLAALAKRLNRSQADTVRLLIREADSNALTQADLVQARARWLTGLRLKSLQLFPIILKTIVESSQASGAEAYIVAVAYILIALLLFWPFVH